ncbi:MAG TPA: META domain-containing protein [Candidatus Limnocylindrales bacterium]
MTSRFVVAVVALLLLSACASGHEPGGSPAGDGAELLGRTFLSTEVSGHSLAPQTRIMLSFPEKGKITANAGCNHLFGEVVFEGDRMKVSDMGGTDMACEQALMAQDQWLTGFLQTGPRNVLFGDELTLTGDGAVLKLVDRKVVEPDQSLLGTRWVVESVITGQSAGSVPAGAEAFLEFDGDRVVGNTGCNSLNGQALHGPGKVVISDIVTTKKACGGDIDALEAAVLAALEGQVTVKVDADRLELLNANGKGLQLRSATEPRPTSS